MKRLAWSIILSGILLTCKAQEFGSPAINCFGISSAGVRASPVMGDMDNDGDFDLLIGTANGSFFYYRNKGTVNGPLFAGNEINPFSLVAPGQESAPALVDPDHDGDADLLTGNGNGDLYYFRNNSPTGISPVRSKALKIHPNPAREYVQINTHAIINQLTIYNSTGQLVLLRSHVPKDLKIIVNSWNPGLYHLHCSTANGQLVTGQLVVV